jgi:hypothetical protein
MSCSGGNGRSVPAASSSHRAATPSAVILAHIPTGSQLKSALLTASDLPSGYVAGLRGTDPPGGNLDCKKFNGNAGGPEAKEAFVAFQSSKTAGSVAFLAERLIGSTLKGARAFFAALVSASRECPTQATKGNAVTIKFTLASEDFPKIGDQTSAWRATGTLSESGSDLKAPVFGEIVFIQDGYVDIEIDNLRVVLPDDTSLTRQAAAKAVARAASIRG